VFPFVLTLKVILFETVAPSGSIPKRFGGGAGGLQLLRFFEDEFGRAAAVGLASFTIVVTQLRTWSLASPN